LGPRNVDQFSDQLTAFNVMITDDLVRRIGGIVPPGGVTVPYYLDDSFADFRPQPYRW
jgi:hypothetical protein